MSLYRRSALLDAHGRPALVAVDPAYQAAGRGRRNAGIGQPNLGVNAALLGNLEPLRAICRDQVRNNPWAGSAIEALVSNAIGTGIKIRSLAPEAAFRTAVRDMLVDIGPELDADGLRDFCGIQEGMARQVFTDGEAFVRFRARRVEDGFAVPLQLQLLEGDHVPAWMNEDRGSARIRCGIEFNGIGQRVAYWMYRDHPADIVGLSKNPGELVRVPAEEVLHVFRPFRAGQLRGEPWLGRVLLRLHEIDAYEDAELVRKKVAALYAMFVTSPNGSVADALGVASTEREHQLNVEPGAVIELEPGEDLKVGAPADVGPTFLPFIRHMLRAVAAAAGLTYEQVTGDMEGVNYSSARVALLEMRRRMLMLVHNVFVHQGVRRIYERLVRDAVLAGVLEAPGFARRPRPYLRAQYIPQGWWWVDPLKDGQAAVLAINNNLTSKESVIGEQGEDIEEVFAARAREVAEERALGIEPVASAPAAATVDAPDAEAPRRRPVEEAA